MLINITCNYINGLQQNCGNTPVNTLRPRQNGRHFADDTFKRIFVNENARISIKFSLKIVPRGPINNIAALVQIMAWRRPGDKPLSEPMMVYLLTHICVTRPQWVNALKLSQSYAKSSHLKILCKGYKLLVHTQEFFAQKRCTHGYKPKQIHAKFWVLKSN